MNKNNNINSKKEKKKKKKDNNWIFILVLTTIILSISMSSVSSIITTKINLTVAFLIVLSIISIGIIFDIIGIAVAAADETPFHAMASSKIKASKYAINLVRNASKVTTFCNDVIGDVCSVISGSTSAFIAVKLSMTIKNVDIYIFSIAVSALVAGITVFGKGIAKSFAISKSNKIVYRVALLQYYILSRLNIISIIRRNRKKCCEK